MTGQQRKIQPTHHWKKFIEHPPTKGLEKYMTDTTKKPMTLEQVLDLIIQAANGESKISRAGCRELADAINAHIATRREGDALAWQYRLNNEEGISPWFEIRNKRDLQIYQSKPHYEVRALYEHPVPKTHAAVTVTDEMVERARRAYSGRETIDSSDYRLNAWMRRALEAVLKGK